MKYDTEIHFRLNRATYDALKEVAIEKDLSCGNICRILVTNYLVKKGKLNNEFKIGASNL